MSGMGMELEPLGSPPVVDIPVPDNLSGARKLMQPSMIEITGD